MPLKGLSREQNEICVFTRSFQLLCVVTGRGRETGGILDADDGRDSGGRGWSVCVPSKCSLEIKLLLSSI